MAHRVISRPEGDLQPLAATFPGISLQPIPLLCAGYMVADNQPVMNGLPLPVNWRQLQRPEDEAGVK
jgi:hypothetical protein